MFIGEYTHTVDDKNRISLPAKFRKELGAKIVVTRGLDNCLFLFPHKTWKTISEELSKLGLMQADTRGFSRFMFSGASEIDVDSQGRVLIPDFLKDFAKLQTTVVFAGVHDRIEIWSDGRWNEYKKHIESQADMMAEKLGSVGIK
ncbi:division/cell wall cluster transcriptional repressor MraZ [Candidatus Parcubacteria bacterium]|nr:division/cell wall cluster transcriptional repressor MraZ [Candidatus Parcubacteria bacterium]